MFIDGGMYRGEMYNGRIHGKGAYQSAFNEIMKGTFVNGVLEGNDCIHKTCAEETYTGRWVGGELNGFGIYRNDKNDGYDGYWLGHLKHGRGYEAIANRSVYRGFFINGMKSGKGELDFGRRFQQLTVSHEDKRNKSHEVSEFEQLFDSSGSKFKDRYQGYFIGGNITNGGVLMDTATLTPYAVARLDKTRNKPIEQYKNGYKSRLQKLKRINEKSIDIETHIRNQILIKKYRIYRQHRHYLKKAMYHEDYYGLDPRIYEMRLRNREARIRGIKDEDLVQEHIKIPRLKLDSKDEIPVKRLQNVFNKIHPQEDEHLGIGLPDELKPNRGFVDNLLAKIAVSDYEEAAERQKVIKYDKLWERAEAAFIEAKKRSNALATAARFN